MITEVSRRSNHSPPPLRRRLSLSVARVESEGDGRPTAVAWSHSALFGSSGGAGRGWMVVGGGGGGCSCSRGGGTADCGFCWADGGRRIRPRRGPTRHSDSVLAAVPYQQVGPTPSRRPEPTVYSQRCDTSLR